MRLNFLVSSPGFSLKTTETLVVCPDTEQRTVSEKQQKLHHSVPDRANVALANVEPKKLLSLLSNDEKQTCATC